MRQIKARDILLKHKDKLDAIAAALLEFETLDGSQIKDIMEHGRMLNPPPPPTKAATPPPLPTTPENRPAKQDDEEEGGLPGELAGVPA